MHQHDIQKSSLFFLVAGVGFMLGVVFAAQGNIAPLVGSQILFLIGLVTLYLES